MIAFSSLGTQPADGTVDDRDGADAPVPWENPTYYQFQAPTITWECMATGYYFPSVGPRGCIMDSGACQCLL